MCVQGSLALARHWHDRERAPNADGGVGSDQRSGSVPPRRDQQLALAARECSCCRHCIGRRLGGETHRLFHARNRVPRYTEIDGSVDASSGADDCESEQRTRLLHFRERERQDQDEGARRITQQMQILPPQYVDRETEWGGNEPREHRELSAAQMGRQPALLRSQRGRAG
jgi:hypothetical protein